jgi:chemotaxis methyl-accepting protein methylase
MTIREEAGFETLTRHISESAGLALGAYKDKCLKRRIAVRMRACGVHTYEDYLAVLEKSPGELQRLTDVLTINVTKFFRNRETWDRLTAISLPGLFQVPGPVRIWSAGCASGEEPHTLAILCAEAAERAGHPEWMQRVVIDATDIDRQSLERARQGVYPSSALAEMRPDEIERYCPAAQPGTHRVIDRLRERLRVRRHDMLIDPPPDPPYDLIVCRNAIIYFDRPTQERLMETLRQAMRPGGYLLLGKVETIFGSARGALELIEPRERIYRRPA